VENVPEPDWQRLKFGIPKLHPHRWWRKWDTVDGRNPAKPPVLYEILPDMGCSQYQLVQDFFHQQ